MSERGILDAVLVSVFLPGRIFSLYDCKISASKGGSREKPLLFDSEGRTSNPDDYF